MTECKQEIFEFQVHGSRKVTGDFSGGYLSSDGGAVFLRGVDLKIGLIERLAGVFATIGCRAWSNTRLPSFCVSASGHWLLATKTFHEKAVKLFLKFISHFSRRAVDRASIRTRYVGPCFDPLLAAKGGTLPSQRRSLHVELPSSYRNRSESSVLSWGSRVPPERLPRRAVRGLGAHSPQQTGSSHGGKGFLRFTGFPEREEQYRELSCDSDDGALLGPCCSLLGET